MKTKLFLMLFSISLMVSCSKDENILQQAERLLPGTWAIVSVELPKYGLGVSYQGNTFVADTVLFGVGNIGISDFSLGQLSSFHDQADNVVCELNIGSEGYPYSLNELFLSGDELFSQFRYNGPEGSFPIETPEEQFIFSSFIFNNNYVIEILDSDHLKLSKANDARHIISLTRQ